MTTFLVPIETFLDLAYANEVWPKSITASKIFQKQVKQRKELLDRLNSITNRLPRPDISLEAAIKQGYIDEKRVAELYSSLSDILESEPEYSRIILYLPFEFLPAKTWRPAEKALQKASDRFKRSYLIAWEKLLLIHDVRANFVDGDVLEIDRRTGDLPRVVKAAHLIPKLVENGFIEVKDIIRLMEISSDQILRDSIAATLPVLADLGFISEKEISLMERSKDRQISSMARIIAANMNTAIKPPEIASNAIIFSFVREKLDREFFRIDTAEYGDITAKRKNWLQQSGKQKVIDDLADIISKAIIENSIANRSAARFIDQKISIASVQALTEGIRKAIELAAANDFEKARRIYGQYQEILAGLWKNDDAQFKETLLKTFRHLYHLKIINDKQLASLNIVMPELAGPFSNNLELIGQEMRGIKNMIRLIEADSELSQLIYPIVLIFGSRLKGCGAQNSDIDLAVFVRPEASFDDRNKIQELLSKIVPHELVRDKIVDFWLEEKNGAFRVHDFGIRDPSLGESYRTHALFGAAWIGDKKTMRELFGKLLVSYLYETDKILYGRNARKLYLEDLEKDTLQYRLMHNGYERFFPRFGGIKTMNAGEIDGKSMFYDSGFRQLATKLFISRVFLPKIPDPEKIK